MIDDLNLSEDDLVLDSGCGPGLWTKMLLTKVFNVVGFDINQDALKVAQKSLNFKDQDRVNFDFGNIGHLTYSNDTFDLTFDANTCMYLAEPLKGIKELKRVTKKEGRVVIKCMDYSSTVIWSINQKLWLKLMYELSIRNPEVTKNSYIDCVFASKVISLMLEAGLKDMKVKSYDISFIAPLTQDQKSYLQIIFNNYLNKSKEFLLVNEYEKLKLAFDPESKSNILNNPDFYYRTVEYVITGVK
jgi:ubiquinone/menaquinone biosynthesis C-methylase UbiE